MRRHRENAAAQHGRPKHVGRGEPRAQRLAESKVEQGQFTCRTGVAPPRGRHLAEQQYDGHDPAADVEAHLNRIHPNDGPNAADERVDDRDERNGGNDESVRDFFVAHRRRNDTQRDRGGEQANAVGQQARDHERARRRGAHLVAKPLAQKLVGGRHRPSEVARQKQARHDDAADDVANRDLQEDERAVLDVDDDRNADDRQRARLGCDDREADGPPRQVAPSQEVVGRRGLLAAGEHPERGDADEVGTDYDEV